MKTKNVNQAIIAFFISIGGSAFADAYEKYDYDASGNITSKNINGVETQMNYDSSNRLVSINSKIGSKIYSYDSAGRPTKITDEKGNVLRSITHGYADKVIASNQPGETAKFYYNAAGYLVGKDSNSKSTSYTWDGNVLLEEGGTVFTNESHPTGGVPVLVQGKDVVLSDYLGNTLMEGTKSFKSTAYGSGLEGARFTGKSYVKELESYVFQNRLYSSITNRWSTADPSGFPDGINNFEYAQNNPINGIDPLGLWVLVRHPVNPPPIGSDTPSTNVADAPTWFIYPTTHAKKWTYKSWVETDTAAVGAVSAPLIGTFSRSETNLYSHTIGLEVGGTFSSLVTVKGSSSYTSGSQSNTTVSIAYNETAIPNNAWEDILVQPKGDIKTYAQDFVWDGATKLWVVNGSPTVTNTESDVLLPLIVGVNAYNEH